MSTLKTHHASGPNAKSEPSAPKILWDQARLRQPHTLADKSLRVRCMFDCIAPTYQRVNSWMSLGRDRIWRKAAVQLAGVTAQDRVLDIGCGTGDLAEVFQMVGPQKVVGLDFASRMLALAADRSARGPGWCQADALRLPFDDQSFTVASCAFGVRSFQDLESGLREMYRVLAPGGRAIVLEFGLPKSKLLGTIYRTYFLKVMPRIATWMSQDTTGAYYYLPHSVLTFATSDEMSEILTRVGFSKVTTRTLTHGVVYILRADKS